MPDKTLMSKLVDELSPAAKIIGAVNTVVNDNGNSSVTTLTEQAISVHFRIAVTILLAKK